MTHSSTVRLPRTIIPFEAEDIASVSCRLAWANGFPCANDMLPTHNVSIWNSLSVMSRKMLDNLAGFSGIAEPELERFWVRPGVIIPFGESFVKRRQINSKVARYCTVCLIEDRKSGDVRRGGNQYLRGHWNWSMIDECHVHGLELSSTTRNPATLPSFDRLLDRTRPKEIREPNEADVYFTSRLLKPRGLTFLDGMPAYVAAELCCVLGEFNRILRSEDRTKPVGGMFVTADLRRNGFAIAKHGPNAINDFLTEYVAKMAHHFDQPRMFYSPARRWWNQNLHNTDYHPIMRLIQDHAEENTPLGRGDTFFWPVLRRKVHSVYTASTEYRMSVDHIRKILDSSTNEEHSHFFKKSVVHRALMDARLWLGRNQVAEILGCSPAVALEIMMSELVTAVDDGGIALGDQGAVLVVHRDEVERLMAEVRSAVTVEPETVEPKTRRLAAVKELKPYGGPLGILRLLRDGHLKTLYSRSLKIRLEDIRVANHDLQRIPQDWLASRDNEADGEMLDMKQARQRIKSTGSTIEALIAKGLVGHVVVENRCRKNGRSRKMVTRSDLDRFAHDHISLAELSIEKGIQSVLLLAELGRRDIFPVIQGDRFVDRHYRRTDIPDDL